MSRKRVVVTGLGLVTPLGLSAESSWRALVSHQSGITDLAEGLRKHNSNSNGSGGSESVISSGQLEQSHWTAELADSLPVNLAAFVDFRTVKYDTQRISPFIAYALHAAEEALSDASWKPTASSDKQRTGVAIGSGIGSLEETILATELMASTKSTRRISPFYIPKILTNMASGHVSIRYNFQGPNHSVATACTAGAHSIGDAFRFIQYGDADVMVTGASEAPINPLSIAGFSRARALSKTGSRPFDKSRDGFVIGEGAGILVLEEMEHALKRNAKIYAEIVGYGLSGDGHHITSPPDNGSGAILSMSRALDNAGIKAVDLDYCNAHATSTPLGDTIELRALQTIFAPRTGKRPLLISSTKGSTGHLLGASGAVESVFSIQALKHGTVPPTLNLKDPEEVEGLELVSSSLRANLNFVASNSFGFGGTNATLIFKKFS